MIPSLTHTAQWAVALVVLVAAVVVGYQAGQHTAPTRTGTRTDTVRVSETQPDTSSQRAVPDVVTLYDTVTVTRVDTVRVPVDLDLGGVTGHEPVRRVTRIFGPDAIELTNYDLSDQRYVQRSYALDAPEWALSPYAEADALPRGVVAQVGARLRWQSVELAAGYAVGEGRGVTLGIRWHPFTLRW